MLLLLRGRVRGPRAAAPVLRRRPAAAAVAGLGSDQPARSRSCSPGSRTSSSTTALARRPRADPGGSRAPRHHRHRDPAAPPLRHPAGPEPHADLRRAGRRGGRVLRRSSCSAPTGLLGDSTAGGLVAVGIVAVAVHPAYALLEAPDRAVGLRLPVGSRRRPAQAGRERRVRRPAARRGHDHRLGRRRAQGRSRLGGGSRRTRRRTTPGRPRVPLVHRGDHIGDLAVEVPAGRTLSAADTALLHDLAQHAAVTVRAAQLAGGAAGLAVADRHRPGGGAQAAAPRPARRGRAGPGRRSCSSSRPPSHAGRSRSATPSSTEIREETKAAITEVRRVVDDLRPPAIDEVGLVGAIRQRAAVPLDRRASSTRCTARTSWRRSRLPWRSRRSGSPRRP